MLAFYERTLKWVLRHPALMLTVALATLVLNIYLFKIIPKGFFPEQDTGRLMGAVLADQDTSFQAMHDRLVQIVKVIDKDPAVDNALAFTGGNGATNTANSFIALKPLDDRKISAQEVIARIRKKASKIPGVSLYMQAVQDLRIGGRSSNAEYQYTLQSDDLPQLMEWAPKLLQKMRSIPQLTDVSSDQQNSGLAANLVIDRDTAARLGISPQLLDNTLYDAFGQRQVSTMYTELNQYHVVMEAAPGFWQNPDGLKQIYINSTNGGQVPLSAVTHYEASTTPLTVNHQGQFPAVTISFNLQQGVALGDAVNIINQAERDIHLPAGIRGTFQGTAQAFQSSLANEPMLILAALLTVYIVLGILYESYINPITILSTLPSAGVRRPLLPAAISLRPQHHRSHRDHFADRHSQEKCHHDDRLRARGGTQTGQVIGRSDLPGVHPALPPHHDDNHGGDARRVAARNRNRHRIGNPPSPRNRDRWRPRG